MQQVDVAALATLLLQVLVNQIYVLLVSLDSAFLCLLVRVDDVGFTPFLYLEHLETKEDVFDLDLQTARCKLHIGRNHDFKHLQVAKLEPQGQ